MNDILQRAGKSVVSVKRCWAVTFMTAAVLCLSAIATAEASSHEVRVHLPAFPVSVNAYSPLVEYNPYPPIVYQDVTYLPMTWDNSQRLGLRLDWNEREGLSIRQEDGKSQPEAGPETGEKVNDLNQTYQAQLADYPVSVNGKQVHNDEEPYPILSFRGITYFPLTWRFAHDEFGWATAWNAVQGFRLISGNNAYIMRGIVTDDESHLYVSTNLYGTIKIPKSLTGMLEAASDEVNTPHTQDQGLRVMEKHPEAQSGQTRMEGDAILLGQVKLLSIHSLLSEANASIPSRTFTEQDMELEDTVIPLGASRLIRISTSLPGLGSILLLEHAGQVTSLDHNLFYRLVSASDGSYWFSSAYKQSETHTYYSRHEQHLWHIDKAGNVRSIHELLGAPMIRVLTGLRDGSVLVLASDNDWDGTAADVVQVQADGTAQKLYSNVKGKVYADSSGKLYMLSPEQNRIHMLGSERTVELTEKMIFQTANGQPQMIPSITANR
ncbi:hypothetical protein [Paenibacillus rigui]|uniref:Copper amine oxidase-like N-terminal domain-containing protein n=1 Tax=Paenibacillus rigui TaxID=554312 RepID=A0A229UWQ1_9BACL|nr:hypothetical protein [Paenibacillus rigui]OXM87691.1 hypothetical protein CF651_00800 [Paenibacillus rigui]